MLATAAKGFDKRMGWLLNERNRSLYSARGLAKFRSLLVSGGVFGLWASHPDAAFQLRLEDLFSRVEVLEVAGPLIRGEQAMDWIYLAQN
jgi:hypothetical protein